MSLNSILGTFRSTNSEGFMYGNHITVVLGCQVYFNAFDAGEKYLEGVCLLLEEASGAFLLFFFCIYLFNTFSFITLGVQNANRYKLTVNCMLFSDDDLFGMVINAIMACTEPKQCSALLLKKYMLDYYPEFKVADRPNLFKKALDRGTSKEIVR